VAFVPPQTLKMPGKTGVQNSNYLYFWALSTSYGIHQQLFSVAQSVGRLYWLCLNLN